MPSQLKLFLDLVHKSINFPFYNKTWIFQIMKKFFLINITIAKGPVTPATFNTKRWSNISPQTYNHYTMFPQLKEFQISPKSFLN